MRLIPFFAVLPMLIACAAQEGAYPNLLPLDELTAQAATVTIGPETRQGLEARAASLRARGAALRRPVLTAEEQERLTQRP